MVIAITLSGVQTGLAGPATVKGPGGNAVYDPNTGALAFVGTEPGQALASLLANPGVAPAAQNAAAFASAFAPQMGLGSASANLALAKSHKAANGRSSVRYHQIYQGLTVFASDVIVNTNAQGAMTSLTAKTSPNLTVDVNPTVTAEAAAARAITATAKYENVAADSLSANTPELQIYDSRLLINDGRPAHLVWKVEVSSQSAPVDEIVLVDAHNGAISLSYNQVEAGLGAKGGPQPGSQKVAGTKPPSSAHVLGTPLISVYTYGNSVPTGESDFGTLVCSSDVDASLCTGSGDADISKAYQYSLDTYNFYATQFSRDSIDNAGLRITSAVHYGIGYANAFWSSVDATDNIPDNQMIYGDGYSQADDVVGHELTHGVTENESALIYWAQPGAINESLSDVFGEFIDQTNGLGTDTVLVKWKIGEDIPVTGTLRSMSNPPLYGDPDKVMSTYFYLGTSDNAGVHTNSGVNNKAAFLMADGGTFNAKTITGLGIYKTAAIYYEVQANLLGSGANYFDLYYALNQACTNLLGSTPPGAGSAISSSDCAQVKKVTDATQMNLTKSATIYPVAPYCPTGQEMDTVTNLFFDDFESGTGLWTLGHEPGSTFDWATSTDDSAGKTTSLLGGNYDDINDDPLTPNNDSWAQMTTAVAIPLSGNPYFHFEHDEYFDSYGTYYFDGGVVEYSKDGGVSWIDAKLLFSAGKNYNGTIWPYWVNPIAGRQGFVGYTRNMVGTRYNLTSLKGYSVKFRFRVGNDDTLASWWYVDNPRIYECVGIPAIPVLSLPALNAMLTNLTPVLDWSNSTPDINHYQVQVDNDPLFGSPEVDTTTGTASTYTVVPGDNLLDGTKYYWRVQAFNINGTSKGWSAAKTFNTREVMPTLVSPTGSAHTNTNRPDFTWSESDPTGVTGYTIQISKNNSFTLLLVTATVPGAGNLTYTPMIDLPRPTVLMPELFWRVKANGINPSAYTGFGSFVTGNSPSTPVLVAPLTNSLSLTYTPTLKWKPVTLGMTPATTFDYFQVQVDDDPAFGSPLVDDTSVVNNTCLPACPSLVVSPAFDPGTTYYWRVKAFVNEGGPDSSGWSKAWTIRAVIATPTTLTPFGATGTLQPLFDWDDMTGATGYVLQVSHNAAFSSLVYTKTIPGVSQYQATINLPVGTLYWRVKATGPNGPSAYSPYVTITVP
jgi:Zn-dependent metalloprotease